MRRSDLQNIEDAVNRANDVITAEPLGTVAMDGFGVFDDDDLSDDDAEPFAVFRTEEEAKGFVLLLGGGCIDPVVRPVKLAGTSTMVPAHVGSP